MVVDIALGIILAIGLIVVLGLLAPLIFPVAGFLTILFVIGVIVFLIYIATEPHTATVLLYMAIPYSIVIMYGLFSQRHEFIAASPAGLEKKRRIMQNKINKRLRRVHAAYKKFEFVEYVEKDDGGYFYLRGLSRTRKSAVVHIYRVYASCNIEEKSLDVESLGPSRIKMEFRVEKGNRHIRDGEEYYNKLHVKENLENIEAAVSYLTEKIRETASDILARDNPLSLPFVGRPKRSVTR